MQVYQVDIVHIRFSSRQIETALLLQTYLKIKQTTKTAAYDSYKTFK